MKLSFVASAVVGAFVAGLIPIQIETDAATVPPPEAQAISPLINGGYLVAAPGRVEPASEEVRIAASVTGVVKEVLVKEGDQVTRGQILARLVSEDAEARVAQAAANVRLQEASLQRVMNGARTAEREEAFAAVSEAAAIEKNASVELTRQRTLGTQNVASKSAVDAAERQFAVAREKHKAALERYSLVNDPARQEDVAIAQARVDAARATQNAAQAELDKTVIRSPIDGTVLRTLRHPGELVSVYVDDPILSLGNLSELYVRAEIDEADIAKLQNGLPAYVTADAYGGKRFSGHIVRIGQMLGQKKVATDDPKERTDSKVLEVLIALDMPNPLRSGLRVDAFIMQPEAQTAASE